MSGYAIGNGPSEGLVDALRAEFGAVLAARILEAEALDFLWETRVCERYLGQHLDAEIDGEGEISRIAIVSFLDGSWHAAVCLADGEGDAVALLWRRECASSEEALAAVKMRSKKVGGETDRDASVRLRPMSCCSCAPA